MSAPPVTPGRVLVDPELDAELAANGWAKISLLSAEEVAELRAGYARLIPPGEQGLAIDYSRTDRAQVRAITALLGTTWDRYVPALFTGHRPVLSTFLAKHPGDATDMRLHREPTFIDPARGHTHNIWIPLDDTTTALDNGALEFIPGTHRLPSWMAGHDTPELFKSFEPYLRQHAVAVDVAAGEAVLFDSELLHFSGPNRTDRTRLAAGCVVAPIDAPLIHVLADGRRRRRIYAVDVDFITDCHPNEVREYLDEHFELLGGCDEGWLLDGADVAREVGGPDADPVAPVPYAGSAPIALDDDGRRLAVGLLPAGSGAEADVESRAHHLHGARRLAPGFDVLRCEGSAAWLPVPDLRGAIDEATLADGLEALVTGPHVAMALVLDPHTRVDLGQPVGTGLMVSVFEAPPVNAGLRAASGLAIAEPGVRIEVPPDEIAELWNGGPGPLWAVVEIAGEVSAATVAAASPAVARLPVLVDPGADERLERDGFVVVPVLTAEQVKEILDGHDRLPDRAGEGLAIDFMREDRTPMAAVAELLGPMWRDRLPEVFTDHEVIVSTFIVKHPDDQSEMGMHNEPTFVLDDEPTYNIWIPLVDVSNEADNGVLRLVLGSEHLPLGLTGYDTPALYRPYDEALRQASWGLDVPAGHGVIYDTRMLHWSDANRSVRTRPAVAASVGRRGSPLVHVTATGRRGRLVYEVDRSFFVGVHPKDVPAFLADRHRLLLEVQEAPVLTAAEVASLPGAPDEVRPSTVLPWHVADRAGLPELATTRLPPRPEPTSDVVADVPALAAGPREDAAELGSIDATGAVAVVSLDQVAAAGITGIEGLAEIAPPDATAAWVFVLDQRTRVEVGPTTGLSVGVFEAAEVNVGVVAPPGVATLTPGVQVELGEPGPTTFWNEGPGQAWLVVWPTPVRVAGRSLATDVRHLAGRVRRAVRARRT